MKHTILILFCLLSLANQSNAQTKDTIIFSRNKFILAGIAMNFNQAIEVMKEEPEAYRLMKKAKLNNTFASIFGFAAGFSVGYPLGQALSGGEPAWGLLAVGGGAAVIATPFMINTKKYSKQAVRVFNAHRLQTLKK